MLQQTQVPRVAEIFPRFVNTFPTFKQLTAASLSEVIAAWSGLGYNRRARYLHEGAIAIMTEHKGRLPRDPAVLRTLPGVGPATASAITVYAFNAPEVYIETNIRAVYIHHFFCDRTGVSDAELMPLITQTLDAEQPRIWYSALMDYGTHLKTVHSNPAKRSAIHKKQAPFAGSNREVRGAVLRMLTAAPEGMTMAAMAKQEEIAIDRFPPAINQLVIEGFIVKTGRRYRLI
jgi:A/G-specific adenine glycosylase